MLLDSNRAIVSDLKRSGKDISRAARIPYRKVFGNNEKVSAKEILVFNQAEDLDYLGHNAPEVFVRGAGDSVGAAALLGLDASALHNSHMPKMTHKRSLSPLGSTDHSRRGSQSPDNRDYQLDEIEYMQQGLLSVNDSLRTLATVQRGEKSRASPSPSNDEPDKIKLRKSVDEEALKSCKTFARAGCFPAWKATAMMAAKKRAKDLGAKNDLEQAVDNSVISSIYATLKGGV